MYHPTELELHGLLTTALERGASDLHLKAGEPPIVRVDGQLLRLEDKQVLTNSQLAEFVKSMLTEAQTERLERQQDVDLSYSLKEGVRFRVNAYNQQGVLGIAFRVIPTRIRTLEELNLPPALRLLAERRQGLALFTGPVGHGKSTAMAALVQEINESRFEHILTIEDPIEFVFTPKRSIITQRELNVDTPSFTQGLKAALREDINVLLVGEMRDLESVAAALTLAETGHLVFATLHTNDAAQTVDRVIDVFPPSQQGQVRAQLASVLLGIVALRLLPKIGGGRLPAYELLFANHAVRNVIREGKTFEINNIIHTSLDAGMIPLDKTLAAMVRQGLVELDAVQGYVRDRDYFNSLLS